GRELLELQCGLYGLTGRRRRARADELLELVGLTDAAGRRIKTYSGGMRRRLDLASALVHSPEVLFLDEPTTGLDPASRLTVWDEVRRINATGTTVFLTTQYLEEADKLCDRLAIIDGGRIVAEGTPERLKAEMGHDVVSVSLDGGDPPAPRGRRPGAGTRGGGRSVTEALLLGRRAVREVARYPEATIPTLFIPLFFLAVNVGQVSKTFPSTTPFLHGQGYVAFQLPVSLMFAVATATSGLALVTEIDNGYFDKLLVAPIRRSSII